MIADYVWEEVGLLLKQGLSVPFVSKQLSISTGSIYKFIKFGRPQDAKSPEIKIPELLSNFEDELIKRIKRGINNKHKYFRELQVRGYKGGYNTLLRYISAKKEELKIRRYKPAIRYETGPGEQAQVDWTYFGKTEIDGKKRKIWAFSYVLGYSRAIYIELAVRQDLKTLFQCHKNAFRVLGIPKKILYDNMKTVAIENNTRRGGGIIYNEAFLHFAKFYDFQIDLCSTYWARTKGKIENAIGYLKKNFKSDLQRRDFRDIDELNLKLQNWLKNIANARVHRTTNKVPNILWEDDERQKLKFPSSQDEYKFTPLESRHATKDSLVLYNHNYYSIPQIYARRKVLVREENRNGLNYLLIYYAGRTICEHRISLEKGRIIRVDLHFQKRKDTAKKPKKLKTRAAKTLVEDYTRSSGYYDKLLN